MTKFQTLNLLAAAAACSALSACGGSDGSTPAPSPAGPNGLYQGQMGDRPMSLLVVDGRFELFYGPAGGSLSTPAGVVSGSLQASAGTATAINIASSSASDFNVGAGSSIAATMTATVVPRQSASGTLVEAAGLAAFSGTYDSSFEATASLDTLAGTYVGAMQDPGGTDAVALNIGTGGSIQGLSSGGCAVTGQAAVHPGVNAYDVRLVFGGGCRLQGQSLNGSAYLKDRTLYAAATDAALVTGAFFVGSRP